MITREDSCRPHHAAESIRTDARTSTTTNEFIETLVRTGAFQEIAHAILETTIDIHDTAKEPLSI